MIDYKKEFIQGYYLFVISALILLMGANAEATSFCSGDVRFDLAVQRDTLPVDGWPQFVHEGKQFKLRAPAPAVLADTEFKQWEKDLYTFEFDKLRDRELLFAYELSNEKNNSETVFNALKEAVQTSEGKDEVLWTAIGVKYDTTDMMMWDKPDLYKRAIVPFKWSKDFHEFIESENDPTTFAELVGATVIALLTGAYFNLNMVESWSASTRQSELVDTGKSSLPPEAIAMYWKMVSKGPCIWLNLRPVASFIAVNRRLDIKGVEEETLLTSKSAGFITGK